MKQAQNVYPLHDFLEPSIVLIFHLAHILFRGKQAVGLELIHARVSVGSVSVLEGG